MEQQILDQKILEELKQMRIDINIIKENMIDIDCILTSEEEAKHEESLKELGEGEVFSFEDVEKERAKDVRFKIK